MWLLGLILIASACDLLHLPPSLSYLSVAFDTTHKIEASGRFFAPAHAVDWEIQVQEPSWLRLSVEPKLLSLHLTLRSPLLHESQTSEAGGLAMLSSKLVPDTKYVIRIDPDAVTVSKASAIDCEQPNLLLNIAVFPLLAIPGLVAIPENAVSGFPDLSQINDFVEFNSFFATYPIQYLASPDLLKPLQTYTFTLPNADSIHKAAGITGTWKFTFTLCNL
jgi:hypothetical protein